MFLESTFDKVSAFEGFIKIYTLKKIAIWNFEPSERSSVYVQSLISHIGDVNKTPTALILFRTLPQIFYVNTIYKYKCNILKYKLKFLKYNFSTRCATDFLDAIFGNNSIVYQGKNIISRDTRVLCILQKLMVQCVGFLLKPQLCCGKG